MQADQRGGGQGEGGKQPCAGGDALRVEVMGEQQEVAKHHDHQGVASCPGFQRLAGHEQDKQGDTGIAAEQSAVMKTDG